MKPLYPLKFKTIFKDKIWGGQKIRDVLGKDFAPLPNCGETWEISGVEGNVSVVSEGELKGKTLIELIDAYKGRLVGKKIFQKFGNKFPLLVKFIDANDDLSIQVHPNDDLGLKRHNSFGKTEMWYVVQAEPGAKLISGFNRPLSREEYLEHFNSGRIMDVLNVEQVKDDDVFFLPAGRVHTIGKGLLIAEIQQTSDITYRIYDFDRTDSAGNKRELHVDEALDAIDFNHYDEYKTNYHDRANAVNQLVQCPYFTTNKLLFNIPVERNFQDIDSFVIYVCMEGEMEINYEGGVIYVLKGEAVLVPAEIGRFSLVPQTPFKVLESYVA